MSEAERRRAILSFSKTGSNNLAEAFSDNIVLDCAGLRTDGSSGASRGRLRDLVALYVGTMAEGHARVRMDEIDRHLDRTYFAWIGGTAPDSVYYRIQSPVVLIEFDHQTPLGLAKILPDPDKPTRQHVHCVVRTPNGNDYGHDLLRQHYLAHPHRRDDRGVGWRRRRDPRTKRGSPRCRGHRRDVCAGCGWWTRRTQASGSRRARRRQ